MAPQREQPLWLKILLNICGPVGVGLALLGVFNAGLGLAFLAGSVLYIGWELYPSAHGFVKRRKWLSLPIFLCVGLAMGLCTWLLLLRINLPKPSSDNRNPETAKPQEAPTILVQYTQSLLPIHVAAQSTVYVLQLNPLIQQQTIQIANPKEMEMWWPEKPRTKDQFPLGPMYECRLTNYGDKALLDLSITFNLSFLSVEKVFSSVRKNPDGTSSISVGAPGADHASFALGLPTGKTLAGRSGSVISEHKHVVTIPAIPPHGSALLYFVSQTKLFSKFVFPETATAIIDGTPTKRLAVLIRPAMSPVDTTKHWILQPSLYEWPSVIDSIFDDAIPWARKPKKGNDR